MIDPKDPAFGNPTRLGFEKDVEKFCGLTKREYFAAMAMQGLMATPDDALKGYQEHYARQAVQMADALIAELNK